MRLFLDIETIPASQKDHEYLKEEFLKKPREIEFAQFVESTSLDGNFGRIFCIGYAVDDKPAEVFDGAEADILKQFWGLAAQAHLFIGHNVMEFDLPFILKRSAIHRIKPSQTLSFARYRSAPIFDTMREWEQWAMRSATSLKTLGHVLGIPIKKGLSGSDVPNLYKEGRLEEIKQYCARDVELTRAIYERMTFQTGVNSK